MILRPYQEKTIYLISEYFKKTNLNLCVVLPTGSGKSHIIAGLCRKANSKNKNCRILMLTHSSELVKQNTEKLLASWNEAPVGIYSAGLKEKDLNNTITFATIQSLARAKTLTRNQFDLVLIDECHRVNANNENTQYLKCLEKIKPKWVIGFTATPFRSHEGYLNEQKNSLFKEIIQPVTIIELWKDGYISRLKTVAHNKKIVLPENIKIKNNDYDEKELNEIINTHQNNYSVCEEIAEFIKKNNITSCLIFCVGIAHAETIAAILIRYFKIEAETLSHLNTSQERKQIINEYKDKKITVITNTNILTTGFDAPDTNCIVFLRPTLSTSLYVQMAGRGMRLKSNNENVCYVLDFVGNIHKHGSLDNLNENFITPKKKNYTPRTYVCINCKSVYSRFFAQCPNCGYNNPQTMKEKHKEILLRLHDDTIMIEEFMVKSWFWNVYWSSKNNQIFSIAYKNFKNETITERLVIYIPDPDKKQKYGIRKSMEKLKKRKINLSKINRKNYITKNYNSFYNVPDEFQKPFCVFFNPNDKCEFSRIIDIMF